MDFDQEERCFFVLCFDRDGEYDLVRIVADIFRWTAERMPRFNGDSNEKSLR